MKSTLLIRYRIEDFKRYKRVFDDFGANRREHGAIRHRLLRTSDDHQEMVVVIEFPSSEMARAFLDDSRRTSALVEAGIHPDSDRAELLEEIEELAY
jgi:uncharacterized protein (DUF1330 family)